MKKQFIIFVVTFITTAAMAQTAEEYFQKGSEAYRNERFTEALPNLVKAGNLGHVSAQYILGILYSKDNKEWGIKKNMQECAKWWEKAANQGMPEAQTRLGLCYNNGDGVPKNLQKAVYWYQKAAAQEFPEAQCLLASCYYDGVVVPKNEQKALELFRKAAAQGQEEAKDFLKSIGK